MLKNYIYGYFMQRDQSIFYSDKLFLKDDDSHLLPTSLEDWRNWVSASRTRNYCIEDTLTDWLDLYGERFGFTKDDSLPDYDSMYDWSKFIFEKGNLFEDHYIDYLKEYGEVVKVGDFTSA